MPTQLTQQTDQAFSSPIAEDTYETSLLEPDLQESLENYLENDASHKESKQEKSPVLELENLKNTPTQSPDDKLEIKPQDETEEDADKDTFFDSTNLNIDIPEKQQQKSLNQIDLDNLIGLDEQLTREFDCLAV